MERIDLWKELVNKFARENPLDKKYNIKEWKYLFLVCIKREIEWHDKLSGSE